MWVAGPLREEGWGNLVFGDSSVAIQLHSLCLRIEKETFFFLSIFLLQDICFTVLGWFQPYTTESVTGKHMSPPS